DQTTVSFDVTNTGARAGSDAPQVYVGYPGDAGEPPQQLRGFSKIQLAAGASTHVSVTLDNMAFAIWDTPQRSFRVPGGTYSIAVGASSRDIRITASVSRPASRIPNGATGQLVNIGLCADVANANDANGTAVQRWTCNGTGAQRWTFAPDG